MQDAGLSVTFRCFTRKAMKHLALVVVLATLMLTTRAKAGESATLPIDLKGEISPAHELTFAFPDGPKGWYARGFRREHAMSYSSRFRARLKDANLTSYRLRSTPDWSS